MKLARLDDKHDVERRPETSKLRKVNGKQKADHDGLWIRRKRREGWTNNGKGKKAISGMAETRTKINPDRCRNAIPKEGETGARRQEVGQNTETQVVPIGTSEGNGRS